MGKKRSKLRKLFTYASMAFTARSLVRKYKKMKRDDRMRRDEETTESRP